VQGRLTGAPVAVRIASRCATCDRPIDLDVDQDLRWRALDAGLRPLIFEPSVDWSRFHGPHILHDY
jgi:hypothetical protein